MRHVSDYLEVLKPRETALLTFIGVCTAIIAAHGHPPMFRLFVALVAVLVASAGANGLTNYLDRKVDARMERTRSRALPSKRINPPEKVLPLTIGLVAIGLALALYLHPLALVFNLIGTTAAVIWRKRATCVFPQGVLASSAPVLIGWFAVRSNFAWELLLLCALISLWLPLHVWSVMIARRDDYLLAGLKYFPMSKEVKESVRVLVVFSLVLALAALALYFIGGFSLLYLIAAIALSLLMVYATIRLLASKNYQSAWGLYKLSAFPFLGLIFLAMVLDLWLR
jgi:heme o synthase